MNIFDEIFSEEEVAGLAAEINTVATESTLDNDSLVEEFDEILSDSIVALEAAGHDLGTMTSEEVEVAMEGVLSFVKQKHNERVIKKGAIAESGVKAQFKKNKIDKKLADGKNAKGAIKKFYKQKTKDDIIVNKADNLKDSLKGKFKKDMDALIKKYTALGLVIKGVPSLAGFFGDEDLKVATESLYTGELAYLNDIAGAPLDDAAMESLIPRKRKDIAILLAETQKRLAKKVKTAADLAEVEATIKLEKEKYNNCIKEMQSIDSDLAKGKLTKDEAKKRIKPLAKLLKQNSSIISYGQVVQNEYKVTDEDVKFLRDYINGLLGIVKVLKISIAKPASESYTDDSFFNALLIGDEDEAIEGLGANEDETDFDEDQLHSEINAIINGMSDAE